MERKGGVENLVLEGKIKGERQQRRLRRRKRLKDMEGLGFAAPYREGPPFCDVQVTVLVLDK